MELRRIMKYHFKTYFEVMLPIVARRPDKLLTTG
jgi:hypothetical protein